ncbi:MAG: DUF4367 domain-containing protein [Oscillospiraceae bacterium]|nr:DUF4367 domain-containing protein [Oscillospiraceae bacterium]
MDENELLKKFLSDNEFEKLAVEKNLKELEKLVKKGDVEKIDEIVDFLLEVQGGCDIDDIDVNEKADEIIRSYNSEKVKKCRKRIPKKFVAVAASFMTLFATNGIVKATTNESLLSLVVDIKESGFSIDFSETIELPTSEDDPYGIRGECQKYGYTPDVPFYLPEGFELKLVDNSNKNPNKIYNSFTFKKGKCSICFAYNYYLNEMGSVTVPSDEYNLSEIEVNGTKAILSQEDDQYVINYQKDKIIYVIFIHHVDYSECDKIIESIK